MADAPETEILSYDEVHALARDTLLAKGCDAPNATAIADNMARAEADGARSHGLFRLALYAKHLEGGAADGQARMTVERLAPAVLRVDAGTGFAPMAHSVGLPALIEAARAQGLAALAITRAIHIAALWPEVSALADAGLVGIAMTGSPPYVAPAGGTRPFFGTNPMAFAWPRQGDQPPMVWDQASSFCARGEISLALREGHSVPEGAGIDADGQPTTDPAKILEGAQLAFGGYKGASIALMVDLLAGPLLGEPASFEAKPAFKGALVPGGEFILALDPAAFGDAAGWRDRGEKLFHAMLAQEGVRLPGMRRAAARAASAADGIPVSKVQLAEIRALTQG